MHTQQAEPAQLRRQLADREGAALEPVGHVRAQPLLAEPPHRLADLALGVAEQGVEGEQLVYGGHGFTVSADRVPGSRPSTRPF